MEAIIKNRYIGKNADPNAKQSLLAFIKPHFTFFMDRQQPWGYDAPSMLPPGNHGGSWWDQVAPWFIRL